MQLKIKRLFESSCQKRRKILHCPENIGNQAKGLSDLEKKQGIHSVCITLRPDPFGFAADRIMTEKNNVILLELARWKLFFLALFGYSEICFNAGKSIMPQRRPPAQVRARLGRLALIYRIYAWLFEGFDIWLFGILGKHMQMIYQGTDARFSTHYTSRLNHEEMRGLVEDHIDPEADIYKARRISYCRKKMAKIWCLNPDLLNNFDGEAKFMPYLNVDIDAVSAHKIFARKKYLVLHAPSRRGVKGSRFIIEAFEQLADEFPHVSFCVIEGLPNNEAQLLYDQADLIVDQLLIGWFGGLAVEAMARGVPVIARVDKHIDLSDTDYFKDLPIINASSETITDTLRKALKLSPAELQYMGRASRNFVEKHHSCFSRAQN